MMLTEATKDRAPFANVLSLVETRMSPVSVGFQAQHKFSLHVPHSLLLQV